MTRIATISAASVIALTSLAGAAGAQPGPGGGYYDHAMMGSGGWFFGPFMMLLFFALLVGAVVIVLRVLGIGGPKATARKSLDILEERFARGEIDRAEFEERKRALGA